MCFIKELNTFLKARYPIIYITSQEEDRLEYTIKKFVKKNTKLAIYTWDFIDGYTNNPKYNGFAIKNPIKALELIENLSPNLPSLFVLKDFNKFLPDIAITRKLKNLVRTLKIQSKTILITAYELDIPDELIDIIIFIEFILPTNGEIKYELRRLLELLKNEIDDNLLDVLVQSSQGLTIERIRQAFSKSIVENKKINEKTVKILLEEKQYILRQTNILDFCTLKIDLKNVGGLLELKRWLFYRKIGFTEKARTYGLPLPKGLLLTGIQGTGKSLTVQAIAKDWQLPLLRLDIGKLFAGVVGESENRTRQMIQISETLAPCILWIDEIDKAFINQNKNNDNGTSSRMLATILTWLAERESPVFVAATANDFSVLPLEIIRKGRFDEIFFLDLPNEEERKQIFQVFLKKVRPNSLLFFDFVPLVKASQGFSGAEINQAITEAMLKAFSQKREFTTHDILCSLAKIIPLSRIEPEKIKNLQNWAISGSIRLAS